MFSFIKLNINVYIYIKKVKSVMLEFYNINISKRINFIFYNVFN